MERYRLDDRPVKKRKVNGGARAGAGRKLQMTNRMSKLAQRQAALTGRQPLEYMLEWMRQGYMTLIKAETFWFALPRKPGKDSKGKPLHEIEYEKRKRPMSGADGRYLTEDVPLNVEELLAVTAKAAPYLHAALSTTMVKSDNVTTVTYRKDYAERVTRKYMPEAFSGPMLELEDMNKDKQKAN